MAKRRERHFASIQYVYCFSSLEIAAYKQGGIDPEKRREIYRHLNIERCRRCRQIYFQVPWKSVKSKDLGIDLKSLPEPKLLEDWSRELPEAPVAVKAGQVWTVRPEVLDSEGNIVEESSMSFPVVIAAAPDSRGIIRVLPLSLDTDFHEKPRTMLLRKSLGYPVLVEIFNERPTLVDALLEFRGSLTRSQWQRLKAARRAFRESDLPMLDDEWQKWADWEVEYAVFLSNPVNAMLADE